MLSRSLYLSGGWFAISLIATLAGGHRLRQGNIFLSAGWLAIVLLMGDVWALLTFGTLGEIFIITAIAFIFGMAWVLWLPNWNAFRQVTLGMTNFARILVAI